ncbi:hypothetical protein ROHU_033572 [Labeo rohita]|uniref:Uncharacterized protein n=1 Tax=Labeo rohita TaxID=84645 RepID=A0A498LIB6_LABRO|nr:hypothetical protein ROHU_033572 [Labeo rohita]
MRNCPEIIAEKERNVGGRSESGDLAGVSGEAEGAPPGEGSVAPAAATPPPASSSETVEGAIAPTHAETRSDEGRKDVDNVTWGKTGGGQADRVSENSAEHFQEMCEIAKCCGREEEQDIFKTPQKRKKSNEVPDAKVSKKIEMHDDEDLETESDAESSDSSVTVSQNFIGRSYELDDIKLFLRSTKNKRVEKLQINAALNCGKASRSSEKHGQASRD